jgi:hypothetical protein
MDETMPERWLPVVGYEGFYEVSDLGRVRSVDRYVATGIGHRPSFRRGRVLKTGTGTKYGHMHVNLWANGSGVSRDVHQIVLTTFRGPRPAGMVIRHLDGDTANNRLANLAYGTSSENSYDTTRHGRNNHASKTHCDNGHEFTPENTRIIYRKNGVFKQRECVTCRRKIAREWAQAKRDQEESRCSTVSM